MQVVTHKETNEYMEEYSSKHSFSFSGPRILKKENIEDGVIIAIKLF